MQQEQFSWDGKHVPLKKLQQEQRRGNINNGYLLNSIPAYPRPELHVSHVSHSTDLQGLRGIRADGGFKDPSNKKKPNDPKKQEELKVVWFSLTVSPEELREAEKRTLRVVHPGGREEEFTPQAVAQTRPEEEPEEDPAEDTQEDPVENLAANVRRMCLAGILQNFATSPAFRSKSRYGSFRFTFSLRDVLNKYKQQFCGGQEPVLRVYRTVLYKQEVMYAVLVHSPSDNQSFSEYPLLQKSSICAFRAEPEPHFVWKPESMGDAYRWEVEVINGELSIQEALWVYKDGSEGPHLYVWDHVALALDVGDKVLKFEDDELRGSLRFCEKDNPSVKPHTQFQTFKEAQAEEQKLWPPPHLKKFSQSRFHVTE